MFCQADEGSILSRRLSFSVSIAPEFCERDKMLRKLSMTVSLYVRTHRVDPD
jgi:hypothetical protein